MLIVEIDGSQHADSAYDVERAQALKANGLRVLRFWNDEVMAALKRRFVVHEQDTESLGPNLRTDVLQLRADGEGPAEESSTIEASVQKWNILQVVLSLTAITLRADTTERLAQGNDETFASVAFTVKTPLALDELESVDRKSVV